MSPLSTRPPADTRSVPAGSDEPPPDRSPGRVAADADPAPRSQATVATLELWRQSDARIGGSNGQLVVLVVCDRVRRMGCQYALQEAQGAAAVNGRSHN